MNSTVIRVGIGNVRSFQVRSGLVGVHFGVGEGGVLSCFEVLFAEGGSKIGVSDIVAWGVGAVCGADSWGSIRVVSVVIVSLGEELVLAACVGSESMDSSCETFSGGRSSAVAGEGDVGPSQS